MCRDTEQDHSSCHRTVASRITVRLPRFSTFVARTRLLRGASSTSGLHKLEVTDVVPSLPATTDCAVVMVPSHQPTSPVGSSEGISTRRSLLRLAPAQVRLRADGSPVLPMISPLPTPKRNLQRHERCQIVLRVLAGERQAHLAKEFGISRAAVSYMLRNPWNVIRQRPSDR